MRSLHIRVILATPVAVRNPFGFIPFDEIIVEAALRRSLKARSVSDVLSPTNPDLVIPELSTDDSEDAERAALDRLDFRHKAPYPTDKSRRAIREVIVLTRIPLARGGTGSRWYWRASFGVCRTAPAESQRQTYLLMSATLEWWCMGDQDKIESLLAIVHTIGDSRRHASRGAVRDWQINRANKDWAVWQQRAGLLAQPTRSVPYADVPDDLKARHLPAAWGLRPPYRHPANQFQVALPPVVGTTFAQESPGDGDLRLDGLTLRRQDRVLVCRGQQQHLTPTETELLAILMQARGQPVWRGAITRRLWPQPDKAAEADSQLSRAAEQSLDVYVHL